MSAKFIEVSDEEALEVAALLRESGRRFRSYGSEIKSAGAPAPDVEKVEALAANNFALAERFSPSR